MPAPLKLVFLGSDAIALPLLNWLAGEGRVHAQVIAVYTQPDRAAGRGQKVQPNAIKTWAVAHGLPVFQPEKLTGAARDQLAVLTPDVALVMAYGHILHDDFIATPRFGTLNLHTSLLPKYRGASPIQTAIACGEQETGVSLMRIVRELDAGPVADVERVAIAPGDTAHEVETNLAVACVPLLARTLPKLAAGTLAFTFQDAAAATYCRTLRKDDGGLDFAAPAAVLAARINGLFPWPACSVVLHGQSVKLGCATSTQAKCHVLSDTAAGAGGTLATPGSVLGHDAEALLIATGDGLLRVLRLQRPGGKMLPAPEFLRGFPIAPGIVLSSGPMAVLLAEAAGRRRDS